MLKRVLVIVLALALALVAYPAAAQKKPKPWKSETITLLVPHPVFYGATEGSVNAVTAKEFEARCDIPASNGFDAAVFAVPKAFQKTVATIKAIGEGSGPLKWDIDIYLYNADCENTLAYQAAGNPGEASDETGLIPKGTAWVLVHNYLGDPGVDAHIELKV